jgi:hypothetical protein
VRIGVHAVNPAAFGCFVVTRSGFLDERPVGAAAGRGAGLLIAVAAQLGAGSMSYGRAEGLASDEREELRRLRREARTLTGRLLHKGPEKLRHLKWWETYRDSSL